MRCQGAKVVVETFHLGNPGRVVVLAVVDGQDPRNSHIRYVPALILDEEPRSSSVAAATIGLGQLGQLHELRRLHLAKPEKEG